MAREENVQGNGREWANATQTMTYFIHVLCSVDTLDDRINDSLDFEIC